MTYTFSERLLKTNIQLLFGIVLGGLLSTFHFEAKASCTPTNKVIKYSADVNIRKSPRVSRGTVLDTVRRGSELTVTQTCNGWYKVKTSSGLVGYMSSGINHSVVSIGQSTASTTSGQRPQFQLSTATSLKTLGAHDSYKGVRSRTLRQLDSGTAVTRVLRRGNFWAQVELEDGTRGWVPRENLAPYTQPVVAQTPRTVATQICQSMSSTSIPEGDSETKYYVCGQNTMDYLTAFEDVQMGRLGDCEAGDGITVCATSEENRSLGSEAILANKIQAPTIPKKQGQQFCYKEKQNFLICGSSELEVQTLAHLLADSENFEDDKGSELTQAIRDNCINYGSHSVCAIDPLQRHYGHEAVLANDYKVVELNKETPDQPVVATQDEELIPHSVCKSLIHNGNLTRVCGPEKEALYQRLSNSDSSDDPKCYRYNRNNLVYCGDSSASREGQYDLDPQGGQSCGFYEEAEKDCNKNQQAKDLLQAMIDSHDIDVSTARVAFGVVSGNPNEGVDCRKAQTTEQNCMICNCAQEVGIMGAEGKFKALNVMLGRFFHYYKKKPNNLCDVVYDSNQLSWTRNDHQNARKVVKGREYSSCLQAYKKVMDRENIIFVLNNPSRVSNHYHANYVRPAWRNQCTKIEEDTERARNGSYHKYYRCPWKRPKTTLAGSSHRLPKEYATTQRRSPTPSFLTKFLEGARDYASIITPDFLQSSDNTEDGVN